MGDYCFFRGNLLLPLIVERKSVEDVALSFADGRSSETWSHLIVVGRTR